MENEIKVGSVVFHGTISGPGTVTRIWHDKSIGVDFYSVNWQSHHITFDHLRKSLMTLAEREARHGR